MNSIPNAIKIRVTPVSDRNADSNIGSKILARRDVSAEDAAGDVVILSEKNIF